MSVNECILEVESRVMSQSLDATEGFLEHLCSSPSRQKPLRGLLQTECLCHQKLCMLKLNPQRDSTRMVGHSG